MEVNALSRPAEAGSKAIFICDRNIIIIQLYIYYYYIKTETLQLQNIVLI